MGGWLIIRVQQALLSSRIFCKCSLSVAFFLREHEILCVYVTRTYTYWLTLKNVGDLFCIIMLVHRM